MMDTFTGWIQRFPTWIEKAEELLKKLLYEIFLRFGLPRSLQSNNGTSFTFKVIQFSLVQFSHSVVSDSL